MTYLFDTNVFITASRLHYGFDIAPGYWRWIGDDGLTGAVASSAWVKKELEAGNSKKGEPQDLLKTWAAGMRKSFWLADTSDSVAVMQVLAAWAVDPGRIYKGAAVAEFMGSVDLKLIALAKAAGLTLVTHEISEPQSRRKVKIPDVCLAHGVSWVDPYAAYRALGMRLTCS